MEAISTTVGELQRLYQYHRSLILPIFMDLKAKGKPDEEVVDCFAEALESTYLQNPREALILVLIFLRHEGHLASIGEEVDWDILRYCDERF